MRDAQTTANLYEIYSKKLEKKISMLETIVTSLIRALPQNVAQNLAVWAILQAYGLGGFKSSEGAK